MSQNNSCSPAVLPPLSERTLTHPSLMPLYMSAGFTRCRTQLDYDTVHAITPAEVFYVDPTVDWTRGRRIPNTVCQFNVLDCFQLNTPPPIMSAGPAPPTRADPFRSRPHAVRDLGSRTCRVPASHPPPLPPPHTNPVVIQLSAEEDQAITNLLKLHHQEFSPGHGIHADKLWLEAELEAAHTLLSGFGPAAAAAEEEEEGDDLAAAPTCEEEEEEEEEEAGALGCKIHVKLSDSEEDAVHVLLTFWDTAAFDFEP